MRPCRLPVYCGFLSRTYDTASSAKYVNTALSGKDNFEKDFQKSHVKTTPFQKFLLGLGSGVISFTSPFRGDMIAVMGEVTGYQAWEYIKSKMMQSEEGRKILEEKPRISSGAVDLEKLKTYPEGTLGKAYSNFLERYKYSPDTRNAVQFVDDLELAYVAQRYREAHDLFHTLLDMPTNMLGEVTVKWVEAIQLKLPMCAAGALFGSVRLAPKFSRTYSTKAIVKLETSLSEKLQSKEIIPKKHPGIISLPCAPLPNNIMTNINIILERKNKKMLVAKAEILMRQVQCRQVPLERYEILETRELLYKSMKSGNVIESDVDKEKELEEKLNRKLKYYNYQWKAIDFNQQTSLEYLISRAPAEYAVLKRVFNEIKKRDTSFTPKTLFDFGSGVGTVVWAAYDFWGSSLEEYYCVDSSRDMNELAAMILRGNNVNNAPIISQVYYRQFLPATPVISDIVVSSFSFFELANCERRLKTLTTLWNNTKEYLVLIENGTNAGFSLINEARDYLLTISRQHGVSCHIFAPCPHEYECPRLTALGKRTPCNFAVKYDPLRMFYKHQSLSQHFCFLIMKKGENPEKDERTCRIVRNVLKRDKHVVCHICTNEGDLKTLFVSACKFGKDVYKCVRSSSWGDLLPGVLKKIESGAKPPLKTVSDGVCNQSDDYENNEDVNGDNVSSEDVNVVEDVENIKKEEKENVEK